MFTFVDACSLGIGDLRSVSQGGGGDLRSDGSEEGG